jgi:radical SAM protein with 4Fe4S-binding SPASM domain
MDALSPLRCRELESYSDPVHGAIRAVHNWAYANCVPLNVTLEITTACNLRCTHCYNRDRGGTTCGAAGPGELSTDEILRVMTELRGAGCLFLGITGGEPLAHPRLGDILDRARRLNLAVQLLTNGTLLDDGAVGRLADYPNLLGLSVSLYGAGPATHEAVTRVPGSFTRTWAGAERARARGLSVLVKFLVMRRNVREVGDMVAAASVRGFSYMIDFCVTARHDRSTDPLDDRATPEEIAALYRGPLKALAPDGRQEITEDFFPCNCARGNCAVTARGDVIPCIAVPWPAGNVREKPFAEIWRDAPVFRRIRGLRMDDYPRCGPCALKRWCLRDRGSAFLAAGEYTGNDLWICDLAEATRRAVQGPDVSSCSG